MSEPGPSRRRPPTVITAEMDAYAARVYTRGETIEHVAAVLGCSYSAARNAVVRGGATLRNPGPRPTPIPDDLAALIVDAYRRGVDSFAEIAGWLNATERGGPRLTESIVRRVLRDRGVPFYRAARRTVRSGGGAR
jgi:hypothetical protein